MATVEFDLAEFLVRFPHLAKAVDDETLTEAQITDTFSTVSDWLGADDANSLYPYDPEHGIFTRKTLLYLATCHMLTLGLRPQGQAGRVASASQGSVSTSFDLLKANSLIGDWWLQTPCGSQYWVMSASYRKGGRVYINKHYHPWG